MSVPKVVIYTRQGVSVPALVLSSRDGEVSHLGENGEPLVTLAFVKFPNPNAPHKRPSVLQASVSEPEIEIERDVVHASHQFSDEYKQKKGLQTEAQIAADRGHGEWTEYEDVTEAADLAPVEDETELDGQEADDLQSE